MNERQANFRGYAFIIIAVIIVLLLAVLVLMRAQPSSRTERPQQVATTPAPSTASPTGSAPSTSVVLGRRTKNTGCDAGDKPDSACTPGAVLAGVTAEQVCEPGYAKNERNVTEAVKNKVYHEYGITHHSPGEFEVDHLISLELGGSNDIANLWPEPASPRPGFHEKDRVEDYLHAQVCAGKMPLSQAQRLIANEWLTVYNRIR